MAKAKAKPQVMVLKRYTIHFKGLALGGSALVLARSKAEAKMLLKEGAPKGFEFRDLRVADEKPFEAFPQLMTFDDGDY